MLNNQLYVASTAKCSCLNLIFLSAEVEAPKETTKPAAVKKGTVLSTMRDLDLYIFL